MNDDRHLIIRFNNGSTLELSFPVQMRNSPAAVLEAAKRIMEGDKLASEADGKLIVVPWANLQQLEIAPVPPAMPFGVIKKAKVVAQAP